MNRVKWVIGLVCFRAGQAGFISDWNHKQNENNQKWECD